METHPSTPDIIVARGCEPKEVKVIEGNWDGLSDHMLVCAKLAMTVNKLTEKIFIPKKRRTHPALVGKAKIMYPHLKYFNAELDQVQNQEQFDDCKKRLSEKLAEPFRPKGRRPAKMRARFFWNNTLEALSTTRSRLYRRMRRTRHRTDTTRYRRIDRKIKRMSKKGKRKTFNLYKRAFLKKGFTDSAKQLSALIRLKRNNRKRHTKQGKAGLDKSEFTRYVANKFPHRPELGEVTPCKFEVTEAMEETIHPAALIAPTGKANGEDETFAEMFKIAPKNYVTHTCFYMESLRQIGNQFSTTL